MSDFVAELRAYANSLRDTWKLDADLADRAADEIERTTCDAQQLLAENERLAAGKAHHLEARLNAGKAMVEAQNAAAIAEAERDKLFEQKLAREVAFADLRAERDRLLERDTGATAHIAALGYLRDRDVAEIKRLRADVEAALGQLAAMRAALEEARDQIIADSPQSAARVISEALAGTSDSVVIHGCFCGQGQYGNPRDCPVHGLDRQQTPDISDGKA